MRLTTLSHQDLKRLGLCLILLFVTGLALLELWQAHEQHALAVAKLRHMLQMPCEYQFAPPVTRQLSSERLADSP
jgi:hypothetical protein